MNPRIVCLGGGRGLSTLLTGLRPYAATGKITLTAGVAMTDDGGDTGARRKEGFPAPGDARRALAVLSTSPRSERFEQMMVRPNGTEYKDGNGWLCDLISRCEGDVIEAFRLANQSLRTVGTVLPVTPANTNLRCILESGRIVVGESAIPELTVNDPIVNISLEDKQAPATPELVRAIEQADLVILGPGSFYTSTLASVLPQQIQTAFYNTSGKIVYACNISTERGETQGWSVHQHVAELTRCIGPVLTSCLVNNRVIFRGKRESELGNIYHISTEEAFIGRVAVISEDLIDVARPLAHDPHKLASCLLRQLPHISTESSQYLLAAGH